MNNTVVSLETPALDALQDILKEGARKLLEQAVAAELNELLEQHRSLGTEEGKRAVVRNGHLPKRTIQTGLGAVTIQVPKVRDRSGSGIKFNSRLLPPYLKRTKNVEEMLPWLYLRGISTGDFSESLKHLLGENAPGLSAATISRLKTCWEDDFEQWRQRDLSGKRYVYIWADGIHTNVRMDDRLCLLVIIGSDEHGRKELLAVEDGYRESSASWEEVLTGLQGRGLTTQPKLAIGDGALGFWKAMAKTWPQTRHQRCWFHKSGNVLSKLPKSMQPKMKEAIRDIWQADTKIAAEQAFKRCIARFEIKYPKAIGCLIKDQEALLSFYDFPAEHWSHIRTSNPIESAFATVRLRTVRSKNCGSRKTTLAMAFKLMETAQKRWRKLRGYKLLADVIEGVRFKDGYKINKTDDQTQEAA